jgi:hypothetical protein
METMVGYSTFVFRGLRKTRKNLGDEPESCPRGSRIRVMSTIAMPHRHLTVR